MFCPRCGSDDLRSVGGGFPPGCMHLMMVKCNNCGYEGLAGGFRK